MPLDGAGVGGGKWSRAGTRGELDRSLPLTALVTGRLCATFSAPLAVHRAPTLVAATMFGQPITPRRQPPLPRPNSSSSSVMAYSWLADRSSSCQHGRRHAANVERDTGVSTSIVAATLDVQRAREAAAASHAPPRRRGQAALGWLGTSSCRPRPPGPGAGREWHRGQPAGRGAIREADDQGGAYRGSPPPRRQARIRGAGPGACVN